MQHQWINELCCCCREMKCSMDGLKFACSWSGSISGARISVKIGKLQLEGCSFDGSRLSENLRDSPSISEIPPCIVAWIPKVYVSVVSLTCHSLSWNTTIMLVSRNYHTGSVPTNFWGHGQIQLCGVIVERLTAQAGYAMTTTRTTTETTYQCLEQLR